MPESRFHHLIRPLTLSTRRADEPAVLCRRYPPNVLCMHTAEGAINPLFRPTWLQCRDAPRCRRGQECVPTALNPQCPALCSASNVPQRAGVCRLNKLAGKSKPMNSPAYSPECQARVNCWRGFFAGTILCWRTACV
jgi:hypothetical protein